MILISVIVILEKNRKEPVLSVTVRETARFYRKRFCVSGVVMIVTLDFRTVSVTCTQC